MSKQSKTIENEKFVFPTTVEQIEPEKLYFYLIHHGLPVFRIYDIIELFKDNDEKLEMLNYLYKKFSTLFYLGDINDNISKIFEDFKFQLYTADSYLNLKRVIFPDIANSEFFNEEDKGKFIIYLAQDAEVLKEIDKSRTYLDNPYVIFQSKATSFLNNLSRLIDRLTIEIENSIVFEQKLEFLETKGDTDLVRIFESIKKSEIRKKFKQVDINSIFNIDYRQALKGIKKHQLSRSKKYAKFIICCIKGLDYTSDTYKDFVKELKTLDKFDWSYLND